MRGLARGATTNRGVEGIVDGAATTNQAGYFDASGATNNYSVYAADGDVYVKDSVGIGDTTPDAKLDVEFDGIGEDGIRINARNTSSSGGDPIVGFEIQGVRKFTMGVDDSDGDKFKIGTSALTTSTRLTITSAGDVGIGDTTPDAKLDVVGVIDGIPVAGMWLYGSTSSTASGFANLVAQMENTNTSYLGYVLNRNYIEIKKSGWYHVFVDVLKISITGTETGSVELRRYSSSGSFQADMCRAFSGGGSGSGYVNMGCSGIDFFSAGNRVHLFDENSTNGIVGTGTSTNRLSSLKIIKLN